MRKGCDGEKRGGKRGKNGGKTGEKTGKKEKKRKRLMIIVASTSLPAVNRPNADRWNADRSCQNQVPRNIKGKKGWVLKMFAVQKDFLVPTIRTNTAWTNVTRMVKSRRIK